MSPNVRFIAVSLLYTVLFSWIYLNEIVVFWSYMAFYGQYSSTRLVGVIAASTVLAVITPRSNDTRSYILTTMLFLFFIPSIVFIGFSYIDLDHVLAFIILISFVYAFSSLKFDPPDIASHTSQKVILVTVFGAIVFAVLIQGLFGGLQYFNLDIERVYEFRRVAAAELPPIFGYVYSNVSSALVPLSLLLSIRFRSRALVILTLVCSVLLFGMTHHKTVLFGPFLLLILYKFYERQPKAYIVALIFLVMPIIGIIEIYYVRNVVGEFRYAYWVSLIIRRVLLVPTMLDSLYIDYFGDRVFFYWSWSRLGSLFFDNPYGQSAPFVIGYEYFSDDETSANAGVIASGYANAGLLGVAIYSLLTGLLLALLNAFGRRIGHPFVAAASLMTVHTVLVSADLLTAILTHGVLLLLVLLALFPSSMTQPSVPNARLQPA